VQYSLWYAVPNTLPVGDLVTDGLLRHQITNWQRIGYSIPQAVLHSLMLLKMGKVLPETCRTKLDLLINRYCCI